MDLSSTAQVSQADGTASAQLSATVTRELAAQASALFEKAPALARHFEDLSEREVERRLQRQQHYQRFMAEKAQDKWFAALVDDSFAVQGRFATWNGFVDFLRENNALVDVWSYGEGGTVPARRIPASELWKLKTASREQPTFITVTWRDASTGAVRTSRVEFSFTAAEKALAAQQAYLRHRQFQITLQNALSARDANGKLSALAQWTALQKAVEDGAVILAERPAKPARPQDLFVAAEYEVDDSNHFAKVVRVYQESEIARRIIPDRQGRATQYLELKTRGGKEVHQAAGYQVRGVSDELVPAPSPVLGQDLVELRVINPNEPDVRKWNVLEFGEPEILKQSALAKFSLVSAHLDRQRKAIALKKSRIDLFVEPVVAGLNIGGGVAGLGVPAGEVARLAYNLVTPAFIADVPKVKELRELFALLAAKEKHPELKTKPAHFLSPRDIEALKKATRQLTDKEVQEYLDRISDEDLDAMLRLARMQRMDAKISNFLNILTSAGKVSGETEKDVLRDIFNTPYFSLNGDVSIKTIMAVAAGGKVTTPFSGVSLESLSRGQGPAKAWLQYFDFTVDVRAVANSVWRLTKKTFAEKKLEKPFPYAVEVTDLAAYEIRIFGYPLFIYYKRGLMKADARAFEEDYAYGIDGAKILEHFKTKEEMDREIRASRMAPIGYVKVPDGKGGWRETNLAVFAHEIPEGKYKGRTVLIIYGLRAYEDHSRYLERELLRFKEFEKALQHGAVIEKLEDAENRAEIPPEEFEPKISAGASASEQCYAPLLGGLLELKRHSQRAAWGLPANSNELAQATSIRQELTRANFGVYQDDALVGVDRYQSTFLYRKIVDGKWRLMKLTVIPSLKDVERELQKAEEGWRVEQARRDVALNRNSTVIFLNEAKSVNGAFEAGPLLASAQNEIFGVGVITNAPGLETVFEQINRLPVKDRARLQFNNFSATLVEMTRPAGGESRKVFLTVEFPGGSSRQQFKNPLTGEIETQSYESGLLKRVTTAKRIVEVEYNARNEETRSRTFFNQGSRERPVQGPLLSETRTLEISHADLGKADLDPHRSTISKLKFDHVTGRATRETYGLFALPVVTADDQSITRNRFNGHGVFQAASVTENGVTDQDFARPLSEKLLNPSAGRERIRLNGTAGELADSSFLARENFLATIESVDLIKQRTNLVTFDNARFGRKTRESYTDRYDRTNSVEITTLHEYRDDFFFGLIPRRSVTQSASSGTRLAETLTQSYDPRSRRLTGTVEDYTGKTSTNIWDSRWESPIQSDTAARRTVNAFNRDETAVTGTTVSTASGEELSRFSGQFDPASAAWRMDRTRWFRPGITNRSESEFYSGFGRLIATRSGELFETRPIYNRDGIEQSRRTLRRNPGSGQLEVLQQVEDDYRWDRGRRDARIQSYVDGPAYDSYRRTTDDEGRTILDHTRDFANLKLRTVITYDGASDRVTKSEQFQNDQLRGTHRSEPEQRQPNGSFLLPVTVLPRWGLVSTQTFLIGDILGRPAKIEFENGDRAQITEWFDGTAIAKTSEVMDPSGRIKERFVRSLNAGTEQGLPFDLTARHKVSPWGGAGLAETEGTLRGTDVSLFSDAADTRIYYDRTKLYRAPLYAVDTQSGNGVPVTLNGTARSSVVKVFSTQADGPQNPAGAKPAAESALRIQAVDLRGLFQHKVTRQRLDRAGNLLEEEVALMPSLGETNYTDAALLRASSGVAPIQKFIYHYDPGWLVEQTTRPVEGRSVTFTNQAPAATTRSWPVNQGEWKQVVARIEGQQEASAGRLVQSGPKWHVFRQAQNPRELERNPFLPDRADTWTEWVVTEFDSDGRRLFDSRTIYDAQGRAAAAKTTKSTSTGEPAAKFSYSISPPPPDALKSNAVAQGKNVLPLGAGGITDFSGADFLYVFVESLPFQEQLRTVAEPVGIPLTRPADTLSPTGGEGRGEGDPFTRSEPNVRLALLITDDRGRTVTAGSENSAGAMPLWSIHPAHVKWLPNKVFPRRAAVVDAPAFLRRPDRVVAVCVPELAAKGLNVRRLNTLALQVTADRGTSVSVSPVYRLAHDGEFIPDRDYVPTPHREERIAGGLTQFAWDDDPARPRKPHAGYGLNAVVEAGGLRLAVTREPVRGLAYRNLVVVDYANTDAPRPLYAVSPDTGRFVEHYKLLNDGGASYVFTVVQGFALPKLEVFDAKILEDEIAPSRVHYGYDYRVTVRYAKGTGFLAQTLAALNNRIGANLFKQGGEQAANLLAAPRPPSEPSSRYHYSHFHHAHIQAHDIDKLPFLAEAILPARPIPWPTNAPAAVPPIEIDQRKLGLELLKLQVTEYPPPKSGPIPATLWPYLIPTSLNTAAEPYVDTVREAEIIKLAVNLGETSLARDLLDFYWEKSQGGRTPLHASYDARAGTAMTTNVLHQRALQSKPTAAAQLAIAEAAFLLGMRTSDSNSLQLGRNLVTRVLEGFRPQSADFRSPANQGEPQGICEYQSIPAKRPFGPALTLWPPSEIYSLGSNARAYILLKEISAILPQLGGDNLWQSKVSEALAEQEAWLRKHILPQIERSGVAPQGVFEIQDINEGTTDFGVERSSAAEDWLTFLEAAHLMGVPPEKTRRWLENLARVHGVRVGQSWGIDFSVPALRPPVISAELTAKFSRVAKLLGHGQAAAFAGEQLGALRTGGRFPSLRTDAPSTSPMPSGQGFFLYPQTNHQSWPLAYGVENEVLSTGRNLAASALPAAGQTARTTGSRILVGQNGEAQNGGLALDDWTVFVLITAAFYCFILSTAFFWWLFRILRGRKGTGAAADQFLISQLVPDSVMQRAEERWAKRVLGVQSPANAEKTRFSNATVEQNFLLQLRAIFKLVLEWRRQENGWDEADSRLAEDETDEWLNGLDEFASVVGIYMRWVIKAGAKDGFSKKEVLEENEDSNHIWSRLVMYLSEHYWGLLTLMKTYSNLVTHQDKANCYGQISQLLQGMGIRQRSQSFDARKLFNFPANPSAMDLLILQKPGMTLSKVMLDASLKLKIPYTHLVGFVEKYKEFKRREEPYPVHPYLIEFAKMLPHFLLMGLGALIWYNQRIGDSAIVPYLWSVISGFVLNPVSLAWALPLFGSLAASVAAHVARVYRFEGSLLSRERSRFVLDATLTSFFIKRDAAMPGIKSGRAWNPEPYQWASWGLRAVGFTILGWQLLREPTPSFATFLVVKGLLAMLAFAEVLAIVLPLAATLFSKFLQDQVTRPAAASAFIQFLNRLNLTATLPASPLWLSIKYHTQPSVPSGGFWGMMQAVLFYFVLAAVFFFVGGYLCQEILSLWFTDTYLLASNGKLFLGSLLFWNTMYLLRYGLFVLFTGIASALASFPIKASMGLLALGYTLFAVFSPVLSVDPNAYSYWSYPILCGGLLLAGFEQSILNALRRAVHRGANSSKVGQASSLPVDDASLPRPALPPTATLGVVYMGGDDLSYQKLTPALLMDRWNLLRDRLASDAIGLLHEMAQRPDPATLEAWLGGLYELEKKFDVTLWHPSQVCLATETPRYRPELGLHLVVQSDEQRRQILHAWHVRRWLVTMMSSAGHAQDTAVNLADIALRLAREGLAPNTVFYLIQNKYDNNDNNRPVQTPYDKGELGQRNKLARLLSEMAPGARAYSIQNWTPFGFKAGGLTGMDLIYEESLKLTTMLLLDRNATVHDLDALMEDLTTALTDPDVIIIIPGRGTTNTLTPVGQGSQLVEEGHRSFLKGLMSMLGGTASESVGTGWGNLLAVFYGRVQRAMVDWQTPKMPITSRMQRGCSFAARAEGLIGFAPHAVGISEDTWAVSQTAHNAMAFGARVKFLLSRAFWHKIRETWSHAEWLASFPRWSGGYLQMMHDPIMQRINDFGSSSVFAKEIRANSGRNFLTAPFALLNILLMPLAILLDLTPFVQILVVLWNFGFLMNQVLTLHGLNTYLESGGFYHAPALLFAGAAGIAAYFVPSLQAFAPGLIALGFLYGGFIVGLNRWLFSRVRDIVLFGPQLVLHALGQFVRQSLEFVLSGAAPADAKSVNMAFRTWVGPREDRPLDTYPHFINLKTVVWYVGLPSVVLNLFALSNLDMLNVLLLLPSLLFSVSLMVGPFVLKPAVGKPIGNWIVIPKTLAWVAAFLFYTIISILIGNGGALAWLGTIFGLSLLAAVLVQGAKYLQFRRRLGQLAHEAARLLVASGTETQAAQKLAKELVQLAAGDPAQISAGLERGNVPPECRATLLSLARERAGPALRKPVQDLQQEFTVWSRSLSEFKRSFVLALLVLVWFFIVPVPGLFVFTAGDYRISMKMGAILTGMLSAVGVVLVGFWIGRFVQWLDREGVRGVALKPRAEKAYRAFESLLASPNRLTPQEVSSLFALFTDLKTYLDQRSYAYARRALGRAEAILRSTQTNCP
ncbi:MAG: hypothetical protein HYY23_07970 [Verrucomicrobia bacterium]|nr:hypothetical protein [Verrucomicrobiota bacterium]